MGVKMTEIRRFCPPGPLAVTLPGAVMYREAVPFHPLQGQAGAVCGVPVDDDPSGPIPSGQLFLARTR